MMNERAERQINDVPYIVFEGEQARSERHIRRLIIALIVAVALLFLSNAFWLYEWMFRTCGSFNSKQCYNS